MGSWRKVLISGSNAHVHQITASAIANAHGNSHTPTVEEKVLVYNTSSGAFYYTGSYGQGGGGTGNPAGNNHNIQFNDGGSFGGDDGFMFDDAQDPSLFVSGAITGSILVAQDTEGSPTPATVAVKDVDGNAVAQLLRVGNSPNTRRGRLLLMDSGSNAVEITANGVSYISGSAGAGTTLGLPKFGIGTRHPSSSLTVVGGVSASFFTLASTSTNTVGITQSLLGGASTMEFTTADASLNQTSRMVIRGNTDTPDIEIYTGASASINHNDMIAAFGGTYKNLGIGNFGTSSNFDTNTRHSQLIVSGNITTTGSNAHITASGNISASGNFSFGAPSTIKSSSAGDISLEIRNPATANTTSTSTLAFGHITSGKGGKIVSVRETNYAGAASNANSALVFHTAVANIDTERLRISSLGHITASGNISSSGALFASTSLSGSHASNNVLLINTATGELYHTGSYGSGGSGGGIVTAINNNTNDNVLTAMGTTELNGEAALTFNTSNGLRVAQDAQFNYGQNGSFGGQAAATNYKAGQFLESSQLRTYVTPQKVSQRTGILGIPIDRHGRVLTTANYIRFTSSMFFDPTTDSGGGHTGTGEDGTFGTKGRMQVSDKDEKTGITISGNPSVYFFNNNASASVSGSFNFDSASAEIKFDTGSSGVQFLTGETTQALTQTLFLSQSSGNPSIGVGTTTPLSTLDVRSVTSSAPANIVLRTNEDGVIEVGEETGRIEFAIESASFLGTNFIASGSTAAMFSRVVESSPVGAIGNLIFTVNESLSTATTPVEAVTIGKGASVSSGTEIGMAVSGNIDLVSSSPRLTVKNDSGNTIALLGFHSPTDFNDGQLLLFNQGAQSVKLNGDESPADASFIQFGNFALGGTTAGERLTVTGSIITSGSGEGHITASGNVSASGDLSIFGEVVHLEGTDPRLKLKAVGANHPGIEWHEDSARKWILYNDPDASQGGNDNLTWKNASDTELMELDQDGMLYVSSKIIHLDDTDTYINFTNDDINIQAGGQNMIDLTSGSQSEITFNEAGIDIDFRVEGDSDANLLFTNAGTDKVGIGLNNPGEKLTVEGNISASGDYKSSISSSNTGTNTIGGNLQVYGTIRSIGSDVKIETGSISITGDITGSANSTGSFAHIITEGDTIEFRSAGSTIGQLKVDDTTGFSFDSGDGSDRKPVRLGSLQTKDIEITGNITASSNISSSGTVTTSGIVSSGNIHLSTNNTQITQVLSAGATRDLIGFDGDNNAVVGNPTSNKVKLEGNVTASGNISASGDLIANSITASIQNLIDFSGLASSGDAEGDIIKIGNTGTTAGFMYVLNGSGGWTASDADALNTATGSLAVALGTNSTTDGMLLKGFVRMGSMPVAPTGSILYVADASGRVTNTAPTGTGQVVRTVGHVYGKNIYFNPSNDFIVHA